jgi:hypothetical protein
MDEEVGFRGLDYPKCQAPYNNKNLKHMNKNYIIIKNIMIVFYPSVKNLPAILGRIFKKVVSMLKNNGTAFTVRYLKESRLHVTR